MASFTLNGRIPSKKNSKAIRIIRGIPMLFSSGAYNKWNKEQLKEIGKSKIGVYRKINSIQLTFFAPDKRKTDLTNKAESIMDLLVDAGIIEDDNWYVIPMVILIFGGIDTINPRCEVTIC